jgi:hypothetical protein
VLLQVHLGYQDGVAHRAVDHGGPLVGNAISDLVDGLMVVHLWPPDLPMNAKSNGRPIASLWRPQLSVMLETERESVEQLRGRCRL